MVEFAFRVVVGTDFEGSLSYGKGGSEVRLADRSQGAGVDAEDRVTEPQERLDGKVIDDSAVGVPAAIDFRRCEYQRSRRRGEDGRDEPATGHDVGQRVG